MEGERKEGEGEREREKGEVGRSAVHEPKEVSVIAPGRTTHINHIDISCRDECMKAYMVYMTKKSQ